MVVVVVVVMVVVVTMVVLVVGTKLITWSLVTRITIYSSSGRPVGHFWVALYYISQSYGGTNGKPFWASYHWQYGIEFNLEALQ